MNIVQNKKYYVKQLNSSKANKMTSLYHYSGVGFKKSALNLGVYRNEDRKLVGVLQWGCSFQEGIKLDRYVKEPISNKEYLELNRFSMADSEGKNSESQAISLGIKWIKNYMPHIKLLVSYAGRKEGNYGYIYQATNWEYLGYFVSEGFWFVDGEERHLLTLYSRVKNQGNPDLGFTENLCNLYEDIRKTWTKQFIYIQRLDNSLTPAVEPMEYPKPANEYPIKTREQIIKQSDDVFNNYKIKEKEVVEYYDEDDALMFTRRTLIRRGEIVSTKNKLASYDEYGKLVKTWNCVKDAEQDGFKETGVRSALQSNGTYKKHYFRTYYNDLQQEIETPTVCKIDGQSFRFLADAAKYIGVSKQALSLAKQKGRTVVKGINIVWTE